MFYVDSESVKVPRLHGGSFQKISNEVPCIGGACPPVSISGNYIGIPTTDRFTYETNYYIFLLPTLGLCNHGMVDSQERLDMLWNDVIREFSYHLAICLGACLAWIAYFWNSVAKFINLMQRYMYCVCLMHPVHDISLIICTIYCTFITLIGYGVLQWL